MRRPLVPGRLGLWLGSGALWSVDVGVSTALPRGAGRWDVDVLCDADPPALLARAPHVPLKECSPDFERCFLVRGHGCGGHGGWSSNPSSRDRGPLSLFCFLGCALGVRSSRGDAMSLESGGPPSPVWYVRVAEGSCFVPRVRSLPRRCLRYENEAQLSHLFPAVVSARVSRVDVVGPCRRASLRLTCSQRRHGRLGLARCPPVGCFRRP